MNDTNNQESKPKEPPQQAEQRSATPQPVNEPAWLNPEYDWARPGDAVEFVTELGIRHLGVATTVGDEQGNGRSYNAPYSRRGVVLMSEDTEYPEYFTMRQVEKWRVTTERAPKKRLLGMFSAQHADHVGLVSMMFITYLTLRMREKVDHLKDKGEFEVYETSHFRNEEGQDQWETLVTYRAHPNGGQILFTEIKEENTVFAHIQTRSGEKCSTYEFKNIGKACEEMARALLGEERR